MKHMNSIKLPVIPNSPLSSPDDKEVFGDMSLRNNLVTGFIENITFDQEVMNYDDNYQNNQSISIAFKEHMLEVLAILKNNYPKGSKIAEVGCGKGDFVEMIEADGWFEVKGYDDAYEGNNKNIEKRFLESDDKLSADIIVLRHVLEHIPQPHKFLNLLSNIFGSADIYIEVPESEWIFKNQAFFDITYEHVNYFTPNSLSNLFLSTKLHGLMFGDQYQFVIGSLDDLDSDFSQAYDSDNWELLYFEGMFPELTDIIDNIDVKSEGRSIYIWGGATKGVLFCHHLNRIKPSVISRTSGVIDINPMKQGKFMPSTHLPIIDVDAFSKNAVGNELVIIMNPNYKQEIEDEIKSRGFNDIKCICV